MTNAIIDKFSRLLGFLGPGYIIIVNTHGLESLWLQETHLDQYTYNTAHFSDRVYNLSE